MSADVEKAHVEKTIAGRYRLVNSLGRGGMGVVWHARDDLLDRDVAVKEIRLAHSDTDSASASDAVVRRALREARAAAQLEHPGIVTVHDVVTDDDRPWIVMELVNGSSLAQVIGEAGALSEQRVAEIGLRVLDALATAHQRGILHRDVKPANILLTGDRVVLTDFGIAAVDGGTVLTTTGQLIGSPEYIAPERISGRPATPAADLWALGATLYTAVAGRSPFKRDDTQATFAAIATSEPEPPPAADRLWPVIHAMLRRDPADRPSTGHAVALLTAAARHSAASGVTAAPDADAPAPRSGTLIDDPAGQVTVSQETAPKTRTAPPPPPDDPREQWRPAAAMPASGAGPMKLARGPVATVYSALRAGRPVVLKVFPTRLDRKTLTVVEREQGKLGALAVSAPILPVHGVDQVDDGRYALRMECCVGSLADVVEQRGALPPDEVVVLGHALARALAAAHGAGILHGGLSPNNVLFRASGEAVLADFGVTLREIFPRDPMHAIEFISPETLRTTTVDERADLYGLGAVLHFALAGSSPHPRRLGEQPGDRVVRVLGSPVPAINRTNVPVELSTVVARLMAPDPEYRPPDAAWVVARLADMLPERPRDGAAGDVRARDLTGDEDPGKRPRPWRRSVVAVGGVAFAATLTMLFVLSQNHSDDPDRRLPSSPTPPASATATAVRLELADPVDRGSQVVLNWTSDRSLDFVVVVAEENAENRYLFAQRNHTMTVQVDPVRKYCFLIQAADSDVSSKQVHETQPKAIRGAICRQ